MKEGAVDQDPCLPSAVSHVPVGRTGRWGWIRRSPDRGACPARESGWKCPHGSLGSR